VANVFRSAQTTPAKLLKIKQARKSLGPKTSIFPVLPPLCRTNAQSCWASGFVCRYIPLFSPRHNTLPSGRFLSVKIAVTLLRQALVSDQLVPWKHLFFIPRQVVTANIFRKGSQLKVLKTVVGVVAIDVVDCFRLGQLPTQMVFHNLPML